MTCYRVGIRMDEPRMAALLTGSGKPGFYLRVLEEGEVEAGDEIVKVGTASERMTIAQANALLYLPEHPRAELERALRIAALSPGWRWSFQALLDAAGRTGNAGLAPASARPAPAGFASMRVARIDRESVDVISLSLEPTDARPLTLPLAGQFIVLRLSAGASGTTLFRSYSLSDAPATDHYRVSVKLEPNGAAASYLHGQVRVGDVLEVSAPRGSFVLAPGDGPVALVSAGIGATPVLAMLHALSAMRSQREVWWLHGARSGRSHPFAADARRLVGALARGRSHVAYSAPEPADVPGRDFDEAGHLDAARFEALGVRRDGDFYLCGPARFMRDITAGLTAWGVAASRIHTESFGGGEALTPGVARRRAAHAASARWRARHRSSSLVRPQRDRGPLGSVGVPEPARAGRGLRRAGQVVVPDRRVSQLRERARVGSGGVPARSARRAGRRQRPHLLRSARDRCGRRYLAPRSGQTGQVDPLPSSQSSPASFPASSSPGRCSSSCPPRHPVPLGVLDAGLCEGLCGGRKGSRLQRDEADLAVDSGRRDATVDHRPELHPLDQRIRQYAHAEPAADEPHHGVEVLDLEDGAQRRPLARVCRLDELAHAARAPERDMAEGHELAPAHRTPFRERMICPAQQN